ncbi:FAD binding domain-containing protein [Lentithecium fluviatile CBS 122367]|uniref:FAD binding domain-containing protein n=1 Tax=Lentithecium fluviatile CBS 122367 TaxID=1168545 RepID=A0A6G1IM02_9PLEO|nr:FAD binding domain-containing protein [Lentithecium fluviatile CBS 122367]
MKLTFVSILLGVAAAAPAALQNCSLPDLVFYSNNSAYETSVNSYWAVQETEVRPACVVIVANAAHVQTAVSVLAKINSKTVTCPFAVRAGGHGKSGNSNQQGGVNIDLSALNEVTVSSDGKEVSMGAGANWGQVAAKLDPLNLAVPGGRDATVGVGGLSLAGGISYFAPQLGFSVDNVNSYEVVLSTGKIVTASRLSNPILFKALKGGGNNFGIATKINMRTFPQSKMWGGITYYDISFYAKQLKAFYDFAADSDYDGKGYIYQSFGLSPSATVVLNNIAYTEPIPELPAKAMALNRAAPSLFSTLRISSLSDFVNEQAAASPPGLRQITYTTTFKLSLDMLESSFSIWNASLPKISAVPGITYSWSNEPLPSSVLKASTSKGSNVMGVADSKEPLVLGLLSASYLQASDDTLMWETMKQVVADIEEKAKATGAFHPWKYAGYAAKGQEVMHNYGAKNYEFLKATSLLYDKGQLFQKAAPGGFKL